MLKDLDRLSTECTLLLSFLVCICLVFILNKIELIMDMSKPLFGFEIYQIDFISKESALIFLMSFLLIHLIRLFQCRYKEEKEYKDS